MGDPHMRRLFAILAVVGTIVAYQALAARAEDGEPKAAKKGTKVRVHKGLTEFTATGTMRVKTVVLIDEDGNEVMIPVPKKITDETLDPSKYIGVEVTVTGKGWERKNKKTGKKMTQIKQVTAIERVKGE
jgi:hypothetical protein